MRRHALILLAGMLLARGAVSEPVKPYRVAVLPTWKNHAHRNEFDFVFQKAGMSWTNLFETVEQMDWLAEHLDDFDMLFGPCLFGYTQPKPYDMRNYAPRIRKWIEGGGSLFIIDVNYGGPLTWMQEMDPLLKAGVQACNASSPAVAAKPLDAILFFPKHAEPGSTWGHMTVPDQEKTGWKIVARCGHGEPTLMVKRMGKGLVLVSSLRSYVPELIENTRVNQRFLALGVEVLEIQIPDPVPGTNTFSLLCRNLSDAPFEGELALTLTPPQAGEGGQRASAAPPEIHRVRGVIGPRTNGVFRLDCRVSTRGPVRAALTLSSGGSTGVCFDREMTLPPLFAVSSAPYRGMVATARRFETIRLGVRIFPDAEELSRHSVRLSILAPGGGVVSQRSVPAQAGSQWIKVPLDLATPPGVYRVRGEWICACGGCPATTDETELTVVGPEPGLTVFDEDRSMLHDGEPFFPLGIYHPAGDDGKLTTDFGVLADLGFNTIQTFSHAGLSHIDLIHRVGAKVLWEILPHRIPVGARTQAGNLATHPAPLLYYTMDEPPEFAFDQVKALDAAFREADPNRPTFVVSYKPHEFNKNVWLSEVLAPDPYPWNKGKGNHSDIVRVSHWMDRANEVGGGMRPYLCVPQAFGGEPPHVWRNMAIQAIAHGAKGLIWYAWNEKTDHDVGLKFNQNLRETAREFMAQIKAIAPAILNAGEPPRMFTAADYRLHGMVCRDPATKTFYLLLASSDKEPLALELAVPEIPEGLDAIHGAFDDASIAVSPGVAKIAFGTFESGIYAWGGPKPVLERPAGEFAVRPLPARGSGRTLAVVAPGSASLPPETFTSLQKAVDAARDGDVIRVAEGVYAPFVSDNRLVDILATGARDKTVIAADGAGRCATLTQKPFGDMAFQTNTLLRGFTLRRGDAGRGAFRRTLGGGALGGTLEDCVLEGNTAAYGGGAAYATLIQCALRENRAEKNGGAAALSALFGCTAERNEARFDGGAFEFCRAERSVARGNRAERDGGGSHYGQNTSCKILDNTARRRGGGSSYSSNTHTLVAGNRAEQGDGGGVFSGVNSFCTIIGNTAGGRGGGAAGHADSGWGLSRGIAYSILWGNASVADQNATASFHQFGTPRTSWVEWGAAAKAVPRGVRTNAPAFLDFAAGDYRLRRNSPCLDAGLDVLIRRGTVDPDGRPRVDGAGADAGAYEAVAEGVAAHQVLGDWVFNDPDRIGQNPAVSPFMDLTDALIPPVEDGALQLNGDFAMRTHRSLRELGAGGTGWSFMTIETTFRAEAGGGALLTLVKPNDEGLWAEVDPNSGVLRVVVVIGETKDYNRFVYETPASITGAAWRNLSLRIHRNGGPEGFLGVSLDDVAVPLVQAGSFQGVYPLPQGVIQVGERDRVTPRFHGALKRLLVTVYRNPPDR